MDALANSPEPPESRYTVLPEVESVWVRMDALFPHPPDAPQTSFGPGLDLTGNVPGSMLVNSWVRSSRGMWLAMCRYFEIPYADGRRHRFRVENQLVPGHALRPRPLNPSGTDDE